RVTHGRGRRRVGAYHRDRCGRPHRAVVRGVRRIGRHAAEYRGAANGRDAGHGGGGLLGHRGRCRRDDRGRGGGHGGGLLGGRRDGGSGGRRDGDAGGGGWAGGPYGGE